MSFTKALVSSRYTVYSLAIAAAVFGIIAYKTLPMQLFPDTAPPLVNVVVVYPGASAQDVSENLSKVLEEEFASIEGVLKINSSSQDNLAVISVEFLYYKDVDQAATEVQNAIASIKSKLPKGIKEPRILKFSTSDRPVISIGLAHKDMSKARKLAEEKIAMRLQQIPGVAAVDLFGGSERAVLVNVNLAKSKAYKIPLLKIVNLLKEHNVALPAGRIRSSRNLTNYRVEARAKNLEDLKNIPIETATGRILLSDIAEIKKGTLDDEAKFAINGKRFIALQVYRTKEANTIEVVRKVEKELEKLKKSNSEYEFVVGEESATFTDVSITNLIENVWQALLFASIIIFLFIGKFKLSIVAVISMPLSYGITFALMKLTNIEFNMVTLTAVILAVGMVVDASVVVLENISRFSDLGEKPKDAVIKGTDEVTLPVIAGATTTIAVLVPLIFTGGFTGKTFGPLAMTLLFAFTSSIVVALVLIPVLTWISLGDSPLDKVGAIIIYPFTKLMDLVQFFYSFLLKIALKQRLLTVLIAVVAMAGGMKLLQGQGMETLPKMDSGLFSVSFETPSGSSLDETFGIAQEIAQIIKLEKEVKTIQTQTGFEEGMKSVSSSGAQGVTQGMITVTLSNRTERKESLWPIMDRVRKKVAKIPGIKVFTVRDSGNSVKSTTKAPIVLVLKGADPLVLNKLGDEVIARLKKVDGVVEPVRNWRWDRKQGIVKIQRQKAAQMGISPLNVATQLQIGSYGTVAGDYYDQSGNSIPLWVKYSTPKSSGKELLTDFPILLPQSGQTIPLRSVIKITEEKSRPLVSREDQSVTLEISAFTKDLTMSFILDNVGKMVKDFQMPRDYKLELSGEKKDLGESKRELLGALIVSLILVYLILVSQLHSFLLPLIIMVSIPLSIIGVALALYITGKPVSMPVMVGLILLAGTVVNNAIILIDFVTISRKQGNSIKKALTDSVKTRFRPIMMTSLSTIIGMIPLAAEWALGAERFSPLAIAVIGGMSVSTLLTMVVIPVLYSLAESATSTLKKTRNFVLRRKEG
jgi:multidrug efflux pump subunit AcrB